jgi:DNA-binding transcriptional regulator YiaG
MIDRDTFKELLIKANLTKKSFAVILDTSYNTINAWGSNNRDIPYWVESWLTLYIENKDCKELKQILRDSGVCNE